MTVHVLVSEPWFPVPYSLLSTKERLSSFPPENSQLSQIKSEPFGEYRTEHC